MRNIPIGSTHWFTIINLLVLTITPSSMAAAFAFSQGNSQRSSGTTTSMIQTSSYPSLNITLNTSAVTIDLGEDAIVALTITGVNGFNDTVALSSSMMSNPPGSSGDGFSGSFSQNAFRVSPASPTIHVNVT